MLDSRALGNADQIERVIEIIGDRFLAIDMLAGCHGLAQQLGAQLRGCGVKEQRVIRVLQGGVEIRGPSRDTMRLGKPFDFVGIASDQDWIGHDAIAILERDATLRPDGHDRPDQMLIHPHSAGDAIHDDTETMLRHPLFPCELFAHVLVRKPVTTFLGHAFYSIPSR